jgi:hypothetical protein
MSEGEIDTLRELLGDKVRGRAKRRRGIEEMMLKEMEASWARLKRRSRRGGGQEQGGYH